eukprot:8097003-Karenia_brevis.AAC.1
MWHENPKPWNGTAAATMHKQLGATLTKKLGVQRKYRIVEDGDPKGFQSNKGITAKKTAKLESWRLPVRSPEWMPLDFSIWAEIERR